MASKTKIFNIDYLTHSVHAYKILGIRFQTEGKPLTIGQMFFQPYKSKEEFEYCSFRTTCPLIVAGLAMLAPTVMIAAVPIITVGIAVAYAALGGIYKLCGNDESGSFYLDTAEDIIKGLCQIIVDLLVIPLSVSIMLTRGISTGLQAAGVYGAHNATEDAPPPSAVNA